MPKLRNKRNSSKDGYNKSKYFNEKLSQKQNIHNVKRDIVQQDCKSSLTTPLDNKCTTDEINEKISLKCNDYNTTSLDSNIITKSKLRNKRKRTKDSDNKSKYVNVESSQKQNIHNKKQSRISKSKKRLETAVIQDCESSLKTLPNDDCPTETFIIDEKRKLKFDDYNITSLELAAYLLGKVLCRNNGNELLCGRIVETEAYLGVIDPACHTYGGKQTERTKPMYMPPGTSYVYTIYGMYSCLNISSADEGGCVLLRALEPIKGLATMQNYRSAKKPNKVAFKTKQLCNGPSKLCQALNITKHNLNAIDMVNSNDFFIVDDESEILHNDIISCKRIGIDGYGQESASLPYRFYIQGNVNVSVKDKEKETSLSRTKR